jgi:hypothetical protein
VICGGFLKLESLDFWMTPSPNEIVGGKVVRSEATRSDNELVASCRFYSSKSVAFCRSKLSLLVAYAA